MSKKKQKINPRRIPRTEVDCERRWKEGCIEGLRLMEAITLRVLIDKHEGEIDIPQLWDELTAYSKAWADGDVTVADVRNSLKEEDKILLMTGPSKAIAHDQKKD